MPTFPEFGSSTGATEVAAAFPRSVKDATFLITGVSLKGLGYATAHALASRSPKHLILSGRSISKVQASIDALKRDFPSVEYTLLQVDLSSLASVRSAAEKINSSVSIPSINGIINNAGVMFLPDLILTDDGLELTFATNYIGHFLLTNLLLPKLIKGSQSGHAAPTRIVNVTSFGHQFGPVRFSDYNFTKVPAELPTEERPEVEKVKYLTGLDIQDKTYTGYTSYAQSKTANVLFSIALNRRLAGKYGIASYAVHPGAIALAVARVKELGFNAEPKTIDQGANTSVLAVLDPGLLPADLSDNIVKGVYLADCQLSEHGAADFAKRQDFAERLWKLSEKIVGQEFEW